MTKNFKVRLFITGIYRSGTTLVSRILNNNSKIWVTYDSVHFMRFSYNRFNPIQKLRNAENLVKEIYHRILRRWKMEFDIDKAISEIHKLKKIDYGYLYDLVMDGLILQYKKDAVGWGEKTNVCWGQIPNFLKMFPLGKTIHVIRDPRDVLCSYREITYEPGFAYLDSAFCSLQSFLKASEYSKTFSKESYYLLKYENLVEDPHSEINNICSFLNIEFEPEMLDVKGFTDKNNNWWDGESSFNKKMNTISKKPIGRWLRKAAPLEIFFVELINREVMRSYGYKLSGINIRKSDWDKLYNILNDNKLLRQRYRHWLKTGEGVEAYPSDPLKK